MCQICVKPIDKISKLMLYILHNQSIFTKIIYVIETFREKQNYPQLETTKKDAN